MSNQEVQSRQDTTLYMSSVKRTPGSKSEVGMMYQYAVSAFLAAKLSTDNNVEDYVLYSSESSAGKFDDVIARVRLKDRNNYYLCLVQVKHKEDKKLNISDTIKGKSVQYFLTHYINSFNEIMSDSYLICRQGILSENIRFGIVTNASVQVPIFLRGQTTFELNLETHSEESPINKTLLPFEGESMKLACEQSEAAEYQNFFERCHLFLNQPNYERIKEGIQTICEIDNANDIIAYVKDYFNNDFLHKQGLSKDQFEIELVRIRFANSIIPLSQPAELINEELIHIWNKITTDQDITIVSNEKDPNIETCLLSCWGQNVISLLNLEINRNDLIYNRSLDDNTIEKFKEYSNSKGRRYWLSIPGNFKSLLIELWRYGELPLILRTNSKLDPFINRMYLRRKYVIVDDFSKRTEEINGISFDVKLFSHVGNVGCIKLRDDLLQNVEVSLQGHKSTSLNTLLREDIELMKRFTTADIISFMKKILPHVKEYYLNGSDYLTFLIEDDTIKNRIGFKDPGEIGDNMEITCNNKEIEDHIKMITTNQEYENYTVCCLRENKQLELIRGDLSTLRNCFNDQYGNPVYYSEENKFVPVIGLPVTLEKHDYMSRCLRKATIPPSYFELEQTHICLVLGDDVSEYIRFVEIDINAAVIELPEKKCNFIKVNEENRQTYWDNLAALKHPLLEMVIKDGKMELIRYKDCDNLSNYITYEGEAVSEEEIFMEVETGCNKITVITGDPGMGKSSLLNSFCNFSDVQDYILLYDLRNFQMDLRQNKKLLDDPIKFIFENFNNKGTLQQFHPFLRHLFETKKLVLVLDSFDEIVSVCEREALKLIHLLAVSGIRIVMTSRLSGCNVLMREFNVRIVNLEPLNEDDVSNYLTKWKINEDKLQVPAKFTANPLYLDLLRLIAEDSEQFLNISRFQLYEKVVNMKVSRYFERSNKIFSQSDLQEAVALLERFSLEVMFGREKVETELKWRRDGRMSDDTKYGIITSFDAVGHPKFYHFTIVEFLVARWLVNAKDIAMYKDFARDIYQQLWREKKLYILDILCEHLKPHQAVLQLDIRKAERLHIEDRNCWKIADDLGRTALHLATIRCEYSPGQYVPYKILEIIVQSMQRDVHQLDKHDTIIEWNWTGYIGAEMLQYVLIYGCVETLKAYLSYRRSAAEDCSGGLDLFPLANFPMAYRAAINHFSIDIIRDLLFLQNRGNKKFELFYQNCTVLNDKSSSFCHTNLEIEGRLKPVHLACIYGSTSMLQNLIEEGCSVNVTDNFGCTPLHYSSILNALDSKNMKCNETKSRMDVMKILLQNCADVNRSDGGWGTPLYVAVRTRNLNVIENFLHNQELNGERSRKLLDINSQNLDGSTALHLAVSMEDEDIATVLLENGADENILNKDGDGPFRIAISKNRLDIIGMLQPGVDLNYQNPYDKSTYLHYAIVKQNSYVVNSLLREQVDVNAQNIYNETPLHEAVKRSNAKIAEMLVEQDAVVSIENVYGKTPLHYAAEAKNTRILQILLRQFSILSAIITGNLDLVKLVMDAEVNININEMRSSESFSENDIAALQKRDLENWEDIVENISTPLDLSVRLQNAEIVELLLRRGANTNATDRSGRTPLSYAVKYKNVDIMILLLKHGADVNFSINSYEECEETALHCALKMNNSDIAKILLEYGADPNLTMSIDNSKEKLIVELRETPLRYCVKRNNVDMVRLLLKHGANTKIKDALERTVFYYAEKGNSIEMSQLLIDHEAGN